MRAIIERFSGFAGDYDAVRPHPPVVALDVLCEIAGTQSPVVVDIGSGTGLSSRCWIGRAGRIVGVEPNDDMRAQAAGTTPPGAVEYLAASAQATGLPTGCADIVTCVQALHWMDPAATFAEVHRCLRPGGVFAALDCDWPPLVDWRLAAPWHGLHQTAERIVASHGLAPGLQRWKKSEHLERMRTSLCFGTVLELGFHWRTAGDVDQLLRLASTQGGLATALKARIPEADEAFATFAALARSVLGERVVPWTYTYRARIGIT